MEAENRFESHLDTIKTSDIINWEELNYPPYIKLIHYKPIELEGKIKKFSSVKN